MKKFILITAFLILYSTTFAQKTVRSSGSAQVELTDDKSRAQVKEEALDLAVVNAIEKAFGRVVIQGNSTYVSNVNTGEKVESNTVFNMIANTSVKGELEEVLDAKYTDIKGTKKINGKPVEYVEIKCDVTIKAREIAEAKVEFDCNTLVCPKINCKTTAFKENDDLFVYLNSPNSGYITIYLDDASNSYRLLPYKDMPAKYESGFPIKADNDYIFFSQAPEHNYLNFEWKEDTYQLYAESQQDINRMFIIYSKEPVNKPRLKENVNIDKITTEEIQKGYSSPKALSSEDFQRWLNNIRSYTKNDMQVAIIDITITK